VKTEINGLTITSNLKQCLTKRIEDFSKKEQARILDEYSFVDEIETSVFVFCRGENVPSEEVQNFVVNTVPQNIRDYFHNHYPTYYCGVGGNSVYLNGSDIILVDEYQEHYIVFHVN